MRLRGRLSARSVLLVVASLAGWIVLLTLERHSQVPICLSQASLDALASGALAHALTADPPALILLSCFAMVVAMMSPLLARPIGYLRLRSATSRRWRATTLFVASYLSVWIIAGMILLSASAALRLLAGTGFAAPLISLAIAAAWHTTPWRQHALNRCHHLPAVAAFGAAADRDCARFGIVHGSWCVLTCSPLMSLPLSAPEFHLPLMAAVAVALFLERMEPGRRPAWTIPNLPGRTAAATVMRSICSRARHAAAS
jgi:predicted metal-binding membrane protein